MENSHLKKKQQNYRKTPTCPATHIGQMKPKIGSTLQRRVGAKDEIILTSEAYKALAMVFDDYGIKKPGWLRRRFLIDQYRRKQLRDVLENTGCDFSVCSMTSMSDGWAYSLHKIWHLISDKPLCKKRK